MAHEIVHIEKGSIADRLGLREGDALAKINGETLIDQIDYQALTAQSPCVLEVIRRDGRVVRHTVHKEDDEPLGITLSDTMLCNPRVCKNHCVFCFIDQMRPGLRKSLYVKDDDWRLSLMMGNFVTLTNVDDQELDRIIRRHVSPLFISVHATDGQGAQAHDAQPQRGEHPAPPETSEGKRYPFPLPNRMLPRLERWRSAPANPG